MAKKMRITDIMGPTDANGEALRFVVTDEMPEKINSTHAIEIKGPVRIMGGDFKGYEVFTWDGRVVEVNASTLETVEWTEDKR